ncbi:calcium/sodium antiporter [candidate division KSB1 bacterium]
MNLFISFLLLIFGLILLIKGADYLVNGASSLAKKMSVTDISIGLTVVAFGTSAPELIVNIFASFQGNTDIVLGNIIGSNIFNILLILGISGIIYPLRTLKNTVWKEIPFSLIAVIALFLLCNDAQFSNQNNSLTRNDGIIMLIFFIIFLVYVFGIAKVEISDTPEIRILLSGRKTVFFIALGFVGLIAGGKIVISSAVNIARIYGVSQRIIGITMVAAGTSLPELFTSAIAAYKGKTDIAIGNVIGSNIFNIFFVLGISTVIKPLTFREKFNFDIYVLIAASTILFFTMFTGKKRSLDRWEAAFFVLLYIIYVVFIILSN